MVHWTPRDGDELMRINLTVNKNAIYSQSQNYGGENRPFRSDAPELARVRLNVERRSHALVRALDLPSGCLGDLRRAREVGPARYGGANLVHDRCDRLSVKAVAGAQL